MSRQQIFQRFSKKKKSKHSKITIQGGHDDDDANQELVGAAKNGRGKKANLDCCWEEVGVAEDDDGGDDDDDDGVKVVPRGVVWSVINVYLN